MDNVNDDNDRNATTIDPSNIYLYFKESDQQKDPHAPPTYVGFFIGPNPAQSPTAGDRSNDIASELDQGKTKAKNNWHPRNRKRGWQRKKAIENLNEMGENGMDGKAEAGKKTDPAQGEAQA